LKILVNIQNSGLKENLTKLHIMSFEQSKSNSVLFEKIKKDNWDFFAVLINYINSNVSVQPLGLEDNIIVQKYVYNFLWHMIHKNQDFKNKIESEFNLLKLLDNKSIKIKEIIEKKIDIKNNIISNPGFYIKMIKKFLKLVKEMIGKDLEMLNKVKLNCNNIYSLIILIIENRKNDFVKSFDESALIIFNQLRSTITKKFEAGEVESDEHGDESIDQEDFEDYNEDSIEIA